MTSPINDYAQCEFVTDQKGRRGIESEYFEDEDQTVRCNAEGRYTCRVMEGQSRNTLQSQIAMGKRKFCREHAQYLVHEAPMRWEICWIGEGIIGDGDR